MPLGISKDIQLTRPQEPFGVNYDSPQSRGLVGWWPFSPSNTFFELYDLIRGNHGQIPAEPATPAWVLDAEKGWVLTFAGTNDRVDVGSPTYSTTEGISWSLWFTTAATPAQFDVIALQSSDTNWADGHGFYWNSSTVLRYFIQAFDTNRAEFTFSSVSLNTWYHVVGTWDRANVRIYVNGVEGTADPYSGTFTEGVPMQFGEGRAQSFNHNGRLFDIRIYNRPLSSAEAFAIYDPYTRFDLFQPLIRRTWVFGGGALTISPAGISSEERFGVSTASPGAVSVLPAGIATGERFGNTTLIPIATISPAGIQTVERFGHSTISFTLSPAGIQSQERFGHQVVSPGAVSISPAGIKSEEGFGNALTSIGAVTLSFAGIGSDERFGNTTLSPGAVTLSLSGIKSEETHGNALVSIGAVTVALAGIGSEERFGNTTLSPGAATVSLAGIASDERFGNVVLTQGLVINPVGIGSAETFGNTTLSPGAVVVAPVGIGTLEAFGLTQALTGVFVTPAGIGSAERFGFTSLSPGAVTIAPPGIPTGEAHGASIITLFINPGTIGSAERFGAITLTLEQLITAAGIPSAERFGSPVLTTGPVTIAVTGIPSGERFGVLIVGGKVGAKLILSDVVLTTLIISDEGVGQ